MKYKTCFNQIQNNEIKYSLDMHIVSVLDIILRKSLFCSYIVFFNI